MRQGAAYLLVAVRRRQAYLRNSPQGVALSAPSSSRRFCTLSRLPAYLSCISRFWLLGFSVIGTFEALFSAYNTFPFSVVVCCVLPGLASNEFNSKRFKTILESPTTFWREHSKRTHNRFITQPVILQSSKVPSLWRLLLTGCGPAAAGQGQRAASMSVRLDALRLLLQPFPPSH